MFTGWLFDHLTELGMKVKVAHPAMLQAIFAGKRKNDTLDARKLADLLRCDYFPECYMVSRELRDRRRALRYRNLVVRQAVRMKNRMSALMMETGLSYNKRKLHQKRYFQEMLDQLRSEMPDSLPELMQYNRGAIEFLCGIDKQLLQTLRHDTFIRDRVAMLTSIPGVGPVVALTWVLEIGEVERFSSIKKVISCQALPIWIEQRNQIPEASTVVFQGWQENPNSIFGDDEKHRRPQMDVWFCTCAGTHCKNEVQLQDGYTIHRRTLLDLSFKHYPLRWVAESSVAHETCL